ncbi:MAG: hypothetical protein IJW73_03225 [Candidatus Gastranaerophilales bacterium]|nr:hypothetical protein [Candidatus Gastranaerophilales bacterium]
MEKEDGFSLVEILVALIAVSCISAALAPVITKKLKSNGVSIGGGGIGGKTEDVEFVMDCSDFGTDCTMCFNDKCVLCTKECNDDQYVNTPDCTCADCTDVDPNCIECTSKKCRKCAENYGLNLSTKRCYLCTNGQSSDGMSECANCPENYFCIDGVKTPCASNQFAPANSTSCTNCADKWEHCIKCNPRECLECEPLYRKKEDGTCMASTQSKEFTTPGGHLFEVPGGVKEIEVVLVSGGAGGGTGNTQTYTHTFVTTGTGNVTPDSTNLRTVESTGLITYTIPTIMKGKKAVITSCGGGGGGGHTGSCPDGNWGIGSGGNGGYVNNQVFTMPNTETTTIQIGGYGGGQAASGGGGSAYGGGTRGAAAGKSLTSSNGSGGGGSNCNIVLTTTSCSGAGGQLGGGSGGNGDAQGGDGGGGGGATLFHAYVTSAYASIIAGGGGGGGGTGCVGTGDVGWGGAGGGGGGYTGGKGGAGGWIEYGNGGTATNGKAGSSTIFGANYCSGGGANANGKPGAMKITYYNHKNGGTGGGSGHIAYGMVKVTPGETLVITVGEGGAGGSTCASTTNTDASITNKGANGTGAFEGMVSSIARADGTVLMKSTTNYTNQGATGGNYDGTTVGTKGAITNGQSSGAITVEGYSNTDGSIADGLKGGMGGTTTIAGSEIHCAPGSGGTEDSVNGGDATGYGGCGGGGGYGCNPGGKGAGGYVKITYGK